MTDDPLQTKLFRQQAIDASRYRWLGVIDIAVSPATGMNVAGAILVCALLAVAAVVIEVPERVRVAGVLMPAGKLLRIRAPRAGIVDRLAVADGDWVGRSQLLMRVGDQRHSAADRSENEMRMRSLQRELALLDTELDHESRSAAETLRLLERRLRLTKRRLHAARQELALRRRQSEVQSRRMQRMETLAERAVIPTQSLDEQRATALQAESEWRASEQHMLLLDAEIVMQRQEIGRRKLEPALIAARAGMRREALLRQLSVATAAEAQAVTSPDGGEIASLLVREGSTVVSGQLLLNIIDPDSRLGAFMYLGAGNAGRVAPGQRVEIQLHAYPYQRFGTVPAEVTSVATVPVPAASLGIPLEIQGSVYEIRARIDADADGNAGIWRRVPAGASFTADLIRERWPLYRWVTRALTAAT